MAAHGRRERRTVDRYLSRCGVASRTDAAALVRAGRVHVNGRTVTNPMTWIDPTSDRVTVDGNPVRPPRGRRVLLLNKPRGLLVTARDPEGRATVRDALPEALRRDPSLRPVGRLDRASAGLLLLINDNDLADRLLRKGSGVEKVYRVKLSPAPANEAVARLRRGIDIGDATPTAPARIRVERRGPRSAVLRITLREGRNRQIRRMAAAIECDVEWLVRIAFGPIELGNLPPGATRAATTAEVAALVECTA